MIKYFFVVLALHFGFALFESAILSNILFLPAIPDFILLCCLYVSFTHGRKIGVCSGFASGMIIDFLSGCPFGLNSLLRTIIGYVSGFFSKTFNTEGIILPMAIAFCGTLCKCLLLNFISFFYPNVINTYHFLSSGFYIELLINTVFAPVIFKFLSVFNSIYPEMDRVAL